MIIRSLIHLTILVLLSLGFWACGGGQATPPPAISVTLNTHAVNVHVTRSALLTATVHNSTNSAVHWSVTGTGCTGTACGTISSAGLYTAPASVPMPATVTVKATSVADGSKSDSATITILAAVVVTVSPANPSIDLGATLQFSASLQNAIDSSVNWSVSGTGCTGTECGTISTTGLYTAPSDASTILTITITATSVEDPAISQSVTATIVSHAWTWISGSDTVSQVGIYGTKGTADPSNISGARYQAVSWTDSSGNFWLFGGIGYDSGGNLNLLNDLWKHDPATNEWTWVSGSNTALQAGIYGTQGIAAPSNVPGSRYGAVSWTDSSGKLWLFGGYGFDSNFSSGVLNDLWKYDPTANEWTWVSGSNTGNHAGIYGIKGTAAPSNVPGGRAYSVRWIDASGKLWLFGGVDGNFSYLNDLWEYDPTTLEWTWVSGSNFVSQGGIYGTKGIADSANAPGGRHAAVSWIDSSGNLWLFGGVGLDSVGSNSRLNDLWKYDPTTNQWTWLSGSNSVDQTGAYGALGAANPANVPGARWSALSWIDPQGKFWLFGGLCIDSAGNQGLQNDLWKYDTVTNEWTWVSGSNIVHQAGIYGTKGIADSSNVPGARQYSVAGIDSNGKLWLFGGVGLDSAGNYGVVNDLWRYTR